MKYLPYRMTIPTMSSYVFIMSSYGSQTAVPRSLRKICKAQGLNWDVQLSERTEAMGGRFPEDRGREVRGPLKSRNRPQELRKKWLVDRLLMFEVYDSWMKLKGDAMPQAQEMRARAAPAPAMTEHIEACDNLKPSMFT